MLHPDPFSKEMGILVGYSFTASIRKFWWLATSPAAGAAVASLWTTFPLCAVDTSARSHNADGANGSG